MNQHTIDSTDTNHDDTQMASPPPTEGLVPPEVAREPLPAEIPPDVQAGSVGEIFDSTKTFASLGLRNSVLKGVEAAGFKQPTSIQATMIPVALQGHDILGQAKTGTGKTAAFGLPLYHMAYRNMPLQSLILAPTRELAIQIAAELTELGQFTPIKVAAIYGGQRISAQADKLKRDPEIIVGTPGRVMDMVERRLLHFRNIKFVVLDEVDRMLDIGFREDIRRILSMCPPPMSPDGTKSRQTIFVSATIGGEVERLARSYMYQPQKLVVSSGSLTVSLVKQFHLPVAPWDKRRLLKHLLTHEEPALTLVFCRLKRVCDELARYLSEKGIDAHAIHADLSQSRRNHIMEKLRAGQLEVLIASDLASRGIDVDGITHVINYDLPEDPDLYVHRIGRTARAGRGGVAWSFVTPEQGPLLTQIENLINAEIPKLDYQDFEPGPLPEQIRKDRERKEQTVAKGNRFAAQPQLPLASQPVASPAAEPVAAGAAPASSAPPAPQRPAMPMPPAALDPAKFPGGVIPTKLPPKRLQGRVRTRGR